MPRLKLIFVLLATALSMLAQRPMTVSDLTAFIKSQIKLKADDRTTAEFLHKVKLTQKLTDSAVEEWSKPKRWRE